MTSHFPAEVWRIIFGNVDTTDEQDLIHLWLSCRLVSRLFKEEIEHIFAAELVPKTSLRVSSATKTSSDPWWMMDKDHRGCWRQGSTHSATFTFERFSPTHPHQAVFRSSSLDDRGFAILFDSLRDQELLRHVVQKPRQQVRVLDRVSEITLPDVAVFPKERRLVLDWRMLFSRFFLAKREGGGRGDPMAEMKKDFKMSSCDDGTGLPIFD